MQSSTVICLALGCFAAAFMSVAAQDEVSSFENLDQYEGQGVPLGLVKSDIAQLRNRCKNFGNCVHDRVCDNTCKQFGYRDGECSGRSCICCS